MNDLWKKKVLVPFWGIEMFWSAGLLAFSVAAIFATQAIRSDEYNYTRAISTSVSILISFTAATLVFDIILIIIYARSSLNPIFYLILAVLKFCMWSFVLGIDIAVASYGGASLLAFIFSGPLWVISLCQLIYGSVITHRYRHMKSSRGNYSPAENGQAGYASQDMDYSYNPHLVPSAYNQAPSSVPPVPDYHRVGGATEYHSVPQPTSYVVR